MIVKVVNQSKHELPQYATELSAGLDLRANIDNPIEVKPLQRVLVPTGLFIELAKGYEAQVRPRSGLAFKNGITVLNSPGTIDADYRGEIKALMINLGQEDFVITRGMRIAQIIIAPVVQVKWQPVETLDDTARSTGGFGSTGIQIKEKIPA